MSTSGTSTAGRPRRRRWLRIVGLFAVAVLATVTAGWFLAPGWVATRVEEALERALQVDATVEGVSLALGGDFGVRSVRLVDPSGREVATVDDVAGHASIGSVIAGGLSAEVSVGSMAATLYEEEDGTWSAERLPRGDGEDDVPPPAEREAGGEPLPDLDLSLVVPTVRLTLVPREGPERVLTAGLQATLTDGDVLALRRLQLDSPFLSGRVHARVEGLSARSADPGAPLRVADGEAMLRYVPDEVRALLAPLVELDLHGAEEQPLELTEVSGELHALDAAGVLGALGGRLQAGVGRLTVAGFTAEGRVDATLAAGRLQLGSDLALNGGVLDLTADVDVAGLLSEAGASDTRFAVSLADVGVGAEFAPLLAPLHPMLAASDALARGSLEGDLDAEVAFHVTAPLRLEALRADPGAFPLASLDAEGTLGLAAALRDLPLVQRLGEALGVDLASGARLDPFAFAIEGGRIGYRQPWTWTIDELRTTFTGTVGLDRTLDLVWNVPVDARLAAKSALFERLEGRALAIPLTGTLLQPRLGLEAALRELAGDALSDTLQDELERRLAEVGLGDRGLGDLTGDGLGDLLDRLERELDRSVGGTDAANTGTDDPAPDDPAALLRRADRLWQAGDKAAAQPLYRRLEKEFSLSPAYLLNRRRVKDRADWKG